MAKGSINEVQYFVHLASRLKYLSADDATAWMDDSDEVARCLAGYIKAVESDLK
jgi:four helix bundle protein